MQPAGARRQDHNRPREKENGHGQPDDHNGQGRDVGKKFQEVGFEQPDWNIAVVDLMGFMRHGLISSINKMGDGQN